uniref:Uncharacterized protein n=1 Tax=Setaria viridis TaxID=4556 RepID=A0A4U6TRN6_SETVI|nr:hypothetical protein SEVIR_7G085901v2 [Setaria viridis]
MALWACGCPGCCHLSLICGWWQPQDTTTSSSGPSFTPPILSLTMQILIKPRPEP